MFRKYQLIVPYGRFVTLHQYIGNSLCLPVTIGHASPLNGYKVAAFALVGKKSDIKAVIKQAYEFYPCRDEQAELFSGIEKERLLDHGKTKLNGKTKGWFSRFRKNVPIQEGSFSGEDIFQAEDALFATIQEGVVPTGMVEQATQATVNAPLMRSKDAGK